MTDATHDFAAADDLFDPLPSADSEAAPDAPAADLGPTDTGAVPPGFTLTGNGLFAGVGDDEDPVRVCGRLEVKAVTHDGTGRSYGRLLAWNGLDGEAHEWAMPMTLLAGDGAELRARLLDEGLDIAPGRKAREALLRYLSAARPAARARVVHRLAGTTRRRGAPSSCPRPPLGRPGRRG